MKQTPEDLFNRRIEALTMLSSQFIAHCMIDWDDEHRQPGHQSQRFQMPAHPPCEGDWRCVTHGDLNQR